MVDNHVAEELKENNEIGLMGFGFNFFDTDKGGDNRSIG